MSSGDRSLSSDFGAVLIQVLKVAILTGASHVARLITMLVILKLIALKTGPAGMGFWGNFITLVSIAGSLAGGGILSGIIKYVAQFTNDKRRCDSFTGSALLYSMGFSLLVALIGNLYAAPISVIIFGSDAFIKWIRYFLILQFGIALNNFAYGVINGEKKSASYALCVIAGNILALSFALWKIPSGESQDIFWSILAPALGPLLPVLWWFLRTRILLRVRFNNFLRDARLLANFSLMLAFSTVCFPVVEILVRNQIIAVISLDAAGYWQAVTRISAAFLSFFSLFLMVYFIPLVSAETNKTVIFRKTCQSMALLGAAVIALMLLVWRWGEYLIAGLYSNEFLLVKPWLQTQLLGDLFRVMAWVIGFLIVAKAKTSWYLLCEILQGGLFLLLANLQIYYRSSVLAVIDAYVLTSFIYFVILLSVFFYAFRYRKVMVMVK